MRLAFSRLADRWSERARRRSAENQETHLSRWECNPWRRPPWDERNALIASLIPEQSAVLDLGAGSQSLKTLLRSCTYQPCDLVQPTSETWLLDFNRGIYPVSNVLFDVVVLSGVIEYARNPGDLLARAASYGKIVLATYAPRRSETQTQREAHGWFNHLTVYELEALFASLGLSYELVGSCLDGQLVYRLGTSE